MREFYFFASQLGFFIRVESVKTVRFFNRVVALNDRMDLFPINLGGTVQERQFQNHLLYEQRIKYSYR